MCSFFSIRDTHKKADNYNLKHAERALIIGHGMSESASMFGTLLLFIFIFTLPHNSNRINTILDLCMMHWYVN